MPRVSLQAPHALDREEALRRVKGKIDELKREHQSQFGDLHEQWDGSTLSFGFRTAGMKVSGTAAVDESQVKLAASLPFAAMIFKGRIMEKVRRELTALLA